MRRYGINLLAVPTTRSEREDKKFTMNDVFAAVHYRMSGRGVCVNAIRRLRLHSGSMLTLVELNEVVDEIVDDSHFYNC